MAKVSRGITGSSEAQIGALVAGDDTAPKVAPITIVPSAAPTNTLLEGEIYWNDTLNKPLYSNGTVRRAFTDLENYAATATSDGLTTGTLPDGVSFVTVTSANANNIIVLPTPTIGAQVTLTVGATGYELRSSSPTTVAINGGTGAAAESAIATTVTTRCICVSATAWICTNYATDGTVTATEAAA